MTDCASRSVNSSMHEVQRCGTLVKSTKYDELLPDIEAKKTEKVSQRLPDMLHRHAVNSY